MYEIPTHIEVEEQSFAIRNQGDYRMVLDCFSALQDKELSKEERIIASLLIFYEDFNDLEDLEEVENLQILVDKMLDFFNCGQPESPGMTMPYSLIDWEADSQMICSAINNVAHKEIRFEPYIHWWTFMGYYQAVGESVLSTVVSIRNKIVKGKKLEKHEKEFRKENPQYFIWNRGEQEYTDEQQSIIDNWYKAGEDDATNC